MPIAITFDTERNCFPNKAGKLVYGKKNFSMINYSIPRFLDISKDLDIPYTFFICGEVAENCPDLFNNIKNHSIGIHTHPFTHLDNFKGNSPNDHDADLLKNYSFNAQYKMIETDLDLIYDNLHVKPKLFRAGRHGVNNDTFKALDELGIPLDSSIHLGFQFLGWNPYNINGTSIIEIPSYVDMSPQQYKNIINIFRLSAIIKQYNGIFIGLIHPMIFGNKNLDYETFFTNYRLMINSLIGLKFDFVKIENMNINEGPKIKNYAGRLINKFIIPFAQILK